MRTLDHSLVEVISQPSRADTQQEYKIAVAGANLKSFKKVGVEFKSKLTGQREMVYVSYAPPFGSGAVPVIYPGAALSNQQCPPPVAKSTDRSFQGFFLALLGQTSAWIIGFSIFIGLLILALVLCCSPRNASGAQNAGMRSPGPRYDTPYGVTPPYGSPYGQSPSQGSYSAGRGPYSASTYAGYRSPGDASGRSIPEENLDEPRRETLSTYRRTTTSTASRSYLSDNPSQAPGGALSLGRTSPSKSPGLFSVTQ